MSNKTAPLLVVIAAFVIFAAIVFGSGSGGLQLGGDFSVPKDESSIGSPFKYYSSTLTENEKKAYFAILKSAKEMPQSIATPPLDDKELGNVLSALLLDNPELYFLGSKCRAVTNKGKCECSFEYTLSPEEYASIDRQLRYKAEEIIASLEEGSDDWSTELQLHDYLVKNCTYLFDGTGTVASAAGALVNKEASCAGYAAAFKYLLDECGIESYLIRGESVNSRGENEPHMWNIVKINGKYYHTDVTWDDPVGTNSSNYDFFNITDDEINIDHSKWSFAYPCDSTEANWHSVKGVVFSAFGKEEKAKAAEVLGTEIERGSTSFSIKFSNSAAYSRACSDLIDDEGVYSLLREAAKKTTHSVNAHRLSYSKNDKRKIITIIPELG